MYMEIARHMKVAHTENVGRIVRRGGFRFGGGFGYTYFSR